MEQHDYRPEQYLERGRLSRLPGQLREVWRARELVWLFFLREFRGRYRQSLLAYVWAILPPVVLILVFLFLHHNAVVDVGVKTGYVPTAMTGLALWTVFSGGLSSTSNSLVSAQAMLTKVNLPKETLVIASLGHPALEFLIRLVLVVLLVGGYSLAGQDVGFHPMGIVFFPLAMVFLLALTMALGLVLALINCIARDVQNIVNLGVTFLLFMTPILYLPKPGKPLEIISLYNPLAHLVGCGRDMLLTGSYPHMAGFWISGAGSLVLLMLAWRLFHVAEPRIPERL